MDKFVTQADAKCITAKMNWEDRDVPKTMFELLNGTAQKFPNNNALSFQLTADIKDPGETLTWAELRDQVCQTANTLRDLGIGENDVVAMLLPNCTEAALTYIGGTIAGIITPINPLLDSEQISGILRDVDAKVLVTLRSMPKSDIAQKAEAAVAQAPCVKHVLEVDLLRYVHGVKRFIVPFIRPRSNTKHHAKISNFNTSIQSRSKTLSFADSTEDRIVAQFHTGGTTGRPKVAQHRASGLIYNAWLGREFMFSSNDVQMCPLPLFHVFATVVSLGSCLGSGSHIVLPTPAGYRGEGVFDNFWKLIERYKATFMITVPTAISALMQRPVDADISSMKLAFSGSAPLPIEIYKQFEQTAGVVICEGYGLTEATCLVSANPPEGQKKIGSVGLPFPYCDVKIMDIETHAEVETNMVGEICVYNPGVSMGKTYSDVGKNSDIYYPGPKSETQYLRTGDLGRLDEDGYLWITGRAKDLIIRGGHNIDPAEIEEALVGHPAIAFAGAIGQPDSHAGELPCVYVELIDGASVTPEELMTYAKDKIHERAAYPKYIEILDELPKTAVGKVFKPDLRRMAITRVYNAALEDAGLSAHVSEVFDSKKQGLVARLSGDQTETDIVRAVLGNFTRPWVWAE